MYLSLSTDQKFPLKMKENMSKCHCLFSDSEESLGHRSPSTVLLILGGPEGQA